jgi:hypothetical protein
METIIGICLLISNPLYYQYLTGISVNSAQVVGVQRLKCAGEGRRVEGTPLTGIR